MAQLKEPISRQSSVINKPASNLESSLTSAQEVPQWTPEEESKVVRKIDMRLMPLMYIAYMLQFIDKITLGNAAIMGIIQDLNLTGSQYSWANSIFYFGYLIASYPVSIGLAKLPIAKYLSTLIIIWGGILMLHSVSGSFGGLMALRFLLGLFESVISPGFSLIVSVWYKQNEHASRHGAWFLGNASGVLAGSFVAYGIAHITNFPPWKVLFILYGGLTTVWGVVLLLFLPDSPKTAKFLTPREREIAEGRVIAFQLRSDRKYDMGQVKEALLDPKSWIIGFYSLLTCFGNGALTAFGGIVIQGFGFSTFHTLLLQIPSAVLSLILVALTTWYADRRNNIRTYLIVALLCLGLAGAVMIRQITYQKVARLFGMIFFSQIAGAFPLMLSMIASNVAGQTKKTVVSAIFFITYCAGNIGGPLVFKPEEAPSYPTAFATMIACVCSAIILVGLLRLLLSRANAKRNAEFGVPDISVSEQRDVGDMTDLQQVRTFRYKY